MGCSFEVYVKSFWYFFNEDGMEMRGIGEED